MSIGRSQDALFSFKGIDYRLHAECDAIRRLPTKFWRNRMEIDLVVTRNDMGESKPCEHCIQYMRSVPVKIRNISYSTRHGYATERLMYISNDLVTLYFRSHAHIKPEHIDTYHPKVKCGCFSTYRYKCKHTIKSLQGSHLGH